MKSSASSSDHAYSRVSTSAEEIEEAERAEVEARRKNKDEGIDDDETDDNSNNNGYGHIAGVKTSQFKIFPTYSSFLRLNWVIPFVLGVATGALLLHHLFPTTAFPANPSLIIPTPLPAGNHILPSITDVVKQVTDVLTTNTADSFIPAVSANASSFLSPRRPSASPLPILARTLYLLLIESSAEQEPYNPALPSVSADVLYYCWKVDCIDPFEGQHNQWYVTAWTSDPINQIINAENKSIPFSRFTTPFTFSTNGKERAEDTAGYYKVEEQVLLINEKQGKERRSWTESRNFMIETAKKAEEKQGWRWAYFIIADGDSHPVKCPEQQLIVGSTELTHATPRVWTYQFRRFIQYAREQRDIRVAQVDSALKKSNAASKSAEAQKVSNIQNDPKYAVVPTPSLDVESICWISLDSLLLTAAPAYGGINGDHAVIIKEANTEAQVNYHYDAMLNFFHSDAVDVITPYCARWDKETWWVAQCYLMYRSVCIYPHNIQFNNIELMMLAHREYPRKDPWPIIDNELSNLHIFPPQLENLTTWLAKRREVMPFVLESYGGWHRGLVPDECWDSMDIKTCARH